MDDRFLDHFFPEGRLERELEAKRRQERRDAEALAYDAVVYRDMPKDLRSRAREWGLESFMCAVWSNAWQYGYMQRGRDIAASASPIAGEDTQTGQGAAAPMAEVGEG